MTDQPDPMFAGVPEPAPAEEAAPLPLGEVPDDLPAPEAVTCTVCKQGIPKTYYEVNGKVLCDPCRRGLAQTMAGGSSTRRFLRALGFGVAAALVGSALYFAILKATSIEFGLIAILVGALVGAAVRKGSDHRGGLLYQVLAILLTYAAIAGSRVPSSLAELNEQHERDQAAAVAHAQGNDQPEPAAGARVSTTVQPAPGTPTAKPRVKGAAPPKELRAWRRPARPAPAAVNIILAIVRSFMFPFFEGPNLIGLLIIFFALLLPWSINRRPKLVVTGPYTVGEKPPASDPGEL